MFSGVHIVPREHLIYSPWRITDAPWGATITTPDEERNIFTISRGGDTMKRFQFIDKYNNVYPIGVLAKTLEVSKNGYYSWRNRPESNQKLRRRILIYQVCEAYDNNHGIYGSRKITSELVEHNIDVYRNTVAKMMREMNLQSKAQKRRSFVLTTDSNHLQPVTNNTLGRQFSASQPDQKWVADKTYIATKDQGWVYMAAVMDLYSRKIVGWAVSDSLETTLVRDALQNAIKRRHPGAGLLHHSDRGSQYASTQYRSILNSQISNAA